MESQFSDILVYALIGVSASLAVICILFTIYFLINYFKRKNEDNSRNITSKSERKSEHKTEKPSKKSKSSKTESSNSSKSNKKKVDFDSNLEEEQDDDEVSHERDFKKVKLKSLNSRPPSPKKKEKKRIVTQTEEKNSNSENDEFFHKEVKKPSKSPKNNKLLVEEVNEISDSSVKKKEVKRHQRGSYEEGHNSKMTRVNDYEIVTKHNVRQAPPMSPIMTSAETFETKNQMEPSSSIDEYETLYTKTKDGIFKPVSIPKKQNESFIPKKQNEQPQKQPEKQKPIRNRNNSDQDRKMPIFTIENDYRSDVLKYKRRSPSPNSEED